MDLLKCEAFLAAADTGSLSAAAQRLGYTPSGITRMVNALESELGFPLLHRSPQGVRLTPEGQQLLPALRQLVHWKEQADQTGARLRGLETGTLTIGSYYSIAARWLPPLLRDFRRLHPGIRVVLLEGSNQDLTGWLTDRRADCCFFSQAPGNWDWIPLQKDELVVWLPADHPCAGLSAFPVERLAEEPFIQIMPGGRTDNEQLFDKFGIRPRVQFSTADNYTAWCMVEAGLGITMNNALMAARWTGSVVQLPLEPAQTVSLGMAVPCLREVSPAAGAFIRHVRQTMGAFDG